MFSPARSTSRFVAAAFTALLAAACGGSTSEPGAGPLAVITVSPANGSVAARGTQRFTAAGADAAGKSVALTAPSWEVTAGGGAIDEGGLFTAGAVTGVFTGTISATSGGVTGHATLTVSPGTLKAIIITPGLASLAIGASQQFFAAGQDADGNLFPIAPTWTLKGGGGTLTAGGLFTAGNVAGSFAATISASSNAVTGTASVGVAPGPLAAIAVTPATASLAAGATQQYLAAASDAFGNAVAITPVWSIAAGGGATSSTGLVTAGQSAGVFANTVKAASGAISGTASLTVVAGALSSISLVPGEGRVTIGGDLLFTATGKDANDNTIPLTPTWSVTAGGGTISSTGHFTGGAVAGVFAGTVRAQSGSVSATATVTVLAGALTTLSISPAAPSLAIGEARQFTASGKDSSGNTIPVAAVWTALAGGTISSDGIFVAGTAAGQFTNAIKATSGGFDAFASVTVGAGSLSQITLTPNTVPLAIGGTQQFLASGKDSRGNPVSISPVWSVVAGGGSISTTGLFTAGAAAGTFTNTVAASASGVTGRATVTVSAGTLATITLTPASATLATSTSKRFEALSLDSHGNAVAATVVWSAGAGGVIDSAGTFTSGTVAGTFTGTVRAQSGAVFAVATVVVTPGALASITLANNPSTMAQLSTVQFTATGADTNGNAVSLTPLWAVVAGGGTIDQKGLFSSGTAAGTFTNTVEAKSGLVTAHATVIVTPGPLAVLTVSPGTANVAMGGTQLFTATGTDAALNQVAVSPVWTVEAGGGAIGGASGSFLAGTVAGTFNNTIKAMSGSVSGTASVTIAPGPLFGLVISGNQPGVLANATRQLTAKGVDSKGNTVPATVAWSVVAGGGAIDGVTGLFTAGATAGTFTNTVLATSGQITAYATMTVTGAAQSNAPPLGSLSTFAVLAGTSILNNVAGTHVTGNVGLTPGTAVVGITGADITGTLYVNSAEATTAQTDLTSAYNAAQNPTLCTTGHDLSGANLNANVIVPGVWCYTSAAGLSGTMTLDGGGDANAVFLFQIGSALTTSPDALYVLQNGAQAKNIYWQVSSSATLGVNSKFPGTILAHTSITLDGGAALTGRALASTGTVTLNNNAVVLP